MRKLILITAMVLASASAQAGDRSLTLGRGDSLPAAASSTVNASDKVADGPVTPAVEAPKPPEVPKYVERPAAAAPAPVPLPQAQPASVQPSSTPAVKPVEQKQATAHKSSHRRYARHWSAGRIIGELHRYGIYW
ncbi:hypothetical protein UP09_16510 [Bradyrhizobium sp. LTSP885]|uniref:hypothetical protein n=1 Tax=Bradyrhizobium sp. LTSP885 TaxID=1619232 RepID=UPI0005C92A0C|nr:hypothetical protein [Bradyrhizobium sp. LTSP885]KJC43949.1 hypothetical protein UP09_16510 [Bradyrhizobium sp. LTSP885]